MNPWCWGKRQFDGCSVYGYNPTTTRSMGNNTRPSQNPPFSPPAFTSRSSQRRYKTTTDIPTFSELDTFSESFPEDVSQTPSPRQSFEEKLNEIVASSEKIDLEEVSNKLIMEHIDSSNRDTERFKEEMIAQKAIDDKTIAENQEKLDKQSALQEEEHRKNVEMMESTNLEKYKQMNEKIEEHTRKTDLKYQESLRGIQKAQKDTLRRIRETRRACQEESENLRRESAKKLQEYSFALYRCIALKQNFEIEEEKWANWLKIITDAIARAKNEFGIIERDLGMLESSEPDRENLNHLHQATLAAYDVVYDGWLEMKKLSEQFSDRIFIFILRNNLAEVSNKLYRVLEAIDNSSISEISRKFSNLNTFDVLSTSELRRLSKHADWESFEEAPDPLVYRKESEVKIEEVESFEGLESSV